VSFTSCFLLRNTCTDRSIGFQKRMNALNTRNRGEQTEEQKTARLRMALFPVGSEVLFVDEELWVPVVKINKVHILPGVPQLFQRLLKGLQEYITLPPISEKSTRILIHTELPESHIAPFLTKLAKRLESEDIKVGSYPK
jgi:molybdopterin-biosynthesis enzyme MoeA-like protein